MTIRDVGVWIHKDCGGRVQQEVLLVSPPTTVAWCQRCGKREEHPGPTRPFRFGDEGDATEGEDDATA